MKIAELSNSVSSTAAILWQYDHAPNLIALIKKWNGLAKLIVEDFWDYFADRVFKIDKFDANDGNEPCADEFGLAVWGNLLGMPRPKVLATENNTTVERPIDTELYRRLLLAHFFILHVPATAANFNEYLRIAFPGKQCHVVDNLDMSMSYVFDGLDDGSDAELLVNQHPDLVCLYPAGICHSDFSRDTGDLIGLAGQELKNFASQFSWVGDRNDGGILAGSPRSAAEPPKDVTVNPSFSP